MNLTLREEIKSYFSYERDENIEVSLPKNIAPQHYANKLYRKSKNQTLALNKLKENIAAKEQQLISAYALEEKILACKSLHELKKLDKEQTDKNPNKNSNKNPRLPFRSFEYQGFSIWVGKDAKSNDLLLKYAFKEDIWLHAKDIGGSHVLLRYRSDEVFNKNVIEYAAQIAAYYSQAKKQTVCPVIYTPKKYVRKKKNLVAGQVVIERENVILVEPLKKDGFLGC